MSRRYDSRTTIFSPEGRLYQVEYAMEAIGNAGTAIGILSKDGVVLVGEKKVTSKLLQTSTSTEKMYKIDDHVACAVAGIMSDANILINTARVQAQRYTYAYQEPMPVEQLVQSLCDTKQGYTQFGGLRPFGVSFLFAGWDKNYGFQLYMSDPSGNYSGWKAAQMVVLPDIEVDIRRLVRKTHKGEFQVEVEQTDSASVEVSVGNSISQRPRTEAKQAPTTGKTVGKKDNSDTAGEKSNLEDPNLTITIPSSEGPDPMQVLMGEDELKDANFLPPIVSLDEFMQCLDSEPPFENLPGDAGKATSISDKHDSEAGSDSKSSGRASQDTVDTMPDKPVSVDASNLKSDSDVELNYIPTKTESIVSMANLKGEHVWEGMLQLTITSMTSVICTFKSGEKTSTKDWPSSLEIKGRVRLDAFEKFLQELPMSRSRAVMVVHFVCKEGSTESERGSLVEAADSYILDGRVGYAEAASGVELYLCPPHEKTLEILSKILSKDQPEALNAIDNGLIGVVVWRRAQLISPNSTSHHKHTSKKQHFTSRGQHEKDTTNMNTSYPSKPTFSHGEPLRSKPPPDDEDDVPPGFGPATSRDEDDLPEFKFSGGSNPSGPQHPIGHQSQRVGIASSHLHSQTSSCPVDQVRELIQKYGQPNSNAPLGVPMQQWNDDDDIPEWQPETTQQQQLQPPPPQGHRFQQPMHAPQQLPHQALPTMHVQGQQNAAQSWQQGTWWVPPPGSQGQPFVNGAQVYRTAVGTGQPAWRKDAPNSRGF